MDAISPAELAAESAIRRALASYCRALDRMDKPAAYAVWHDDGTALYHDIYEGSGHGFVDWVWQAHAGFERHSHQIAQSLITVEGDSARSESYVTVALWLPAEGEVEGQEIVSRGRYLDRWSRRGGRWAIDHREHILDLQSIYTPQRGYVNAVSRRDGDDASFAFLSGGM